MKLSSRQTLGGLFFVYLITRLLNLTKLPIFNDEAIYLDWGWRQLHVSGNLFLSLTDAKPPLLMWIFGLMQSLVKDPLLAGRIVSVLTGLCSLILIYKIAKESSTVKGALFAATCYILIPLFALYDRQALMESSIGLIGLSTYYFTSRLINSQRLKDAVILGIILGLGLFIKSSAILFLITSGSLILIAAFLKKNWSLIPKGVITVSISQLIISPMYLQPIFWKTLNMNSRFSLTFPELLSFPIKTWAIHIMEFAGISFWQLTPFILIFAISGLFLYIKSKDPLKIRLSFWFLFTLVLTIIFARNITPRYLMPILLPLCIFPGYAISKIRPIVIFTLLIPGVALAVQIFSPITYFNLLNKVTSYSGLNEYITGWPSGYGVPEVIDILKKESTKRPILAMVRGDAGNPESSIFAYFNGNPRILPVFLDQSFVKKTRAADCLLAPWGFYFISRDGNLGGLHRFFEKPLKFYKPHSNSYVGLHKQKKSCSGKTLWIQL